MNTDIFRGVGVEIKLKNPTDFLKVKETLTRIGISSKKENTLYQSCHILHKQSRYVILHFKELFILDGKTAEFDDQDIARRNTICKLLDEWGLVKIVNGVLTPTAPMNTLKIVSFKDKQNWNLVSKYNVGKKSHNKSDNSY